MKQGAPRPLEAAALSMLKTRKGARRPIIVFGTAGTPGADGWRPEEWATEVQKDVYLGPLVGGNEESFETALSELIIWGYASLLLKTAGVLVPRWTDLDAFRRDLLVEAVRSLAVPEGARLRMTDRPEAAEARLPLWRVNSARSGRLIEITQLRSGRSSDSLRRSLEELAPSAAALQEGLTSLISRASPRRDFASACRVAAQLQASGWAGVRIGRYLTAYGYENSRGVPGAWHHARLQEALAGDQQ